MKITQCKPNSIRSKYRVYDIIDGSHKWSASFDLLEDSWYLKNLISSEEIDSNSKEGKKIISSILEWKK